MDDYSTPLTDHEQTLILSQLNKGQTITLDFYSLHPDAQNDCIWGCDSYGLDFMACTDFNPQQALNNVLALCEGDNQTQGEAMMERHS